MNLLIITYHYFHRETPFGIKDEDHPFSVTIDTFERHCVQLQDSSCAVIEPDNLVKLANDADANGRQVMVTIDDGHISVNDLALDILLKHNIKPMLNISPGLVGEKYYCDWSSLRHLAASGVSIQSHSMTHGNMALLNRKAIEIELAESKKAIEDNIGAQVFAFAAPMGRLNRMIIEMALETGYSAILTSYTGINRSIVDLHGLKRFQVKSHLDELPLDKYFARLSQLRVVGAAKNMVKRLRDRNL